MHVFVSMMHGETNIRFTNYAAPHNAILFSLLLVC
jgi:hypothetical protein